MGKLHDRHRSSVCLWHRGQKKGGKSPPFCGVHTNEQFSPEQIVKGPIDTSLEFIRERLS